MDGLLDLIASGDDRLEDIDTRVEFGVIFHRIQGESPLLDLYILYYSTNMKV